MSLVNSTAGYMPKLGLEKKHKSLKTWKQKRTKRRKAAARTSKPRAKQQAGQRWRQGVDESERQISSLIRGYAGKVDRRAATAEPKARPGHARARVGPHRLLARAHIVEGCDGGTGSGSGLRGGKS